MSRPTVEEALDFETIREALELLEREVALRKRIAASDHSETVLETIHQASLWVAILELAREGAARRENSAVEGGGS